MPTSPDPPREPPGAITRRTAGNAAALALAELVGKVFTLAYTVVAARVLTPDEFGRFVYALAIALLVVVIPKWGFSVDLIRRASAARERLDALLSASLVWTLGIGLITFTTVGVLTGLTRDTTEGVVVLVLMLVATLFDVCSDRLRAAAAALERQRATSIALIVDRIVTGLLIIGLLVAGAGVVGMGVGYLAGSVLDLVLSVVVIRRMGVRPGLRAPRSDLRGLLTGSWVIGLSTVAAMLQFRVDQVIIEALLGTAALAVYAVAYRLVETVLFLTWSLSRAVLPVVTGDPVPWRLRRALHQGVAVLAVVYVPFAAVALFEPGDSIALLFGQRYVADGVAVLRWLAAAPLLFGVSFLASQVLFAERRERFALLANASATVLNVVLNLALIPRYGIAAAAAVTTATLAVRAVVAVSSSTVDRLWRGMVTAPLDALIAVVGLAVVLTLVELPILLELVLAGVVYGALWVLVARRRSPEHVDVLRSTFRRPLPGGPPASETG